nr:hypothetical protein [uncultured Fluviicola sp.]
MKTLLLMLLSVCSLRATAQTSKEQVPLVYPVQQLLGVEYEIKDVSQPDNNRLLLIPYVELTAHRARETDVEIFDPASNYTIVLYSDVKCQQNKH